MKSRRPNPEQVKAANENLRDTLGEPGEERKKPITNPVEGEGLPGERPDLGSLKFERVAPERIKVGGWKFRNLAPGESVAIQVDRIVSAEEAEASPDDKPLFEGIYAYEYPSRMPVILNAHFQLLAFLSDEVAAGAHRSKVYEVTMLEERQIKGGRTVYDYGFREALLP